jgi:hypothetical protein
MLWKIHSVSSRVASLSVESEAPSEGEKPKYDSIGELVTLPSGAPEDIQLLDISGSSDASTGIALLSAQSACVLQAYSIVRWRLAQVARYILHLALQVCIL